MHHICSATHSVAMINTGRSSLDSQRHLPGLQVSPSGKPFQMMDCRISSHFCAQRRSKDELEQNIFKQSDFKTSAKISIAGTEEVIKIKMFRKLTSTSLEGNTQCSRACYV